MDRFLLLPLLLLLLVTFQAILVAPPVAMARPLGVVGSAEPPSTATGVATASNGTAAASAPSSAQGAGGGRPDKSIAGAEVILGGFATAVFAIIFCYIRVTRRHAADGDA